MQRSLQLRKRISRLLSAMVYLIGCFVLVSAQQEPPQDPNVVRISTDLVQTPVIVLDQQRRFVPGLNRDQFQLLIDGQEKTIQFLDHIKAGTRKEAQKYPGSDATAPQNVSPINPGRTILFLVDDAHLSQESLERTRSSLLHYIDHSMGQNDRVLITSTTGQIGFLQQLTDNKDVLRAAAERLKYRETFTPDDRRPPMSPYQALRIMSGESRVLDYFADVAIAEHQINLKASSPVTDSKVRATMDMRADLNRRLAEEFVRNRARMVLQRYSVTTAFTLSVLKQFLGPLKQLPGSKLAFLISDGFLLNNEIPGELQKLHDIVANALRSNVIVYSIQASGLMNSYVDAKQDVRTSARLDTGNAPLGQDTAMQTPLSTIAVDSGGRVLFNSNSIQSSIDEVLQETSEYYVVAWRPEPKERGRSGFRRVQVKINDHPEWTARAQKAFLSIAANDTKHEPSTAKPASVRIRERISALYPISDVPIALDLTFLAGRKDGVELMVATEVPVTPFTREGVANESITLAGILLNDSGQTVGNLGRKISLNSDSATSSSNATVSHAELLIVKPGIYQVRVVAHDESAAVIGSATEWIVIPDLASGRLTLSSIIIGDTRTLNSPSATATQPEKARISISHHFDRSSRLRFMTHIYNARRSQATTMPDVSIQLSVLRDNQVISRSSLAKISTEGLQDLTRIPHAAELSLKTLPAGTYTLLITATDNIQKSSTSRSVKFVVD